MNERMERSAAGGRMALAALALALLPVFAAQSAQASAQQKAAAEKKAQAPKARPQAGPAKPKPKATAKAKAKTDPKAVARKGKAGARPGTRTAAPKKEAEDAKPGPLADFRGKPASADVVQVANWVSVSRNAKKKAFVVIDKKQARMYVFDPQGRLRDAAPVLLGSAVGDHSAPGVGNKPLAQLKPEEKTTPAGRFLARPGRNSRGHDIIWIDYDAAVSMHRVLRVGNERRFERLASATPEDNRVSNGCVNVPIPFYNGVLKPTVMKYGAIVYVLPETRSLQQQFGAMAGPAAG